MFYSCEIKASFLFSTDDICKCILALHSIDPKMHSTNPSGFNDVALPFE